MRAEQNGKFFSLKTLKGALLNKYTLGAAALVGAYYGTPHLIDYVVDKAKDVANFTYNGDRYVENKIGGLESDDLNKRIRQTQNTPLGFTGNED